MSTTDTDTRARRARFDPLSADRIAPGMFEVSNRRSDSVYTVDVRTQSCTCPDFEYRQAAVDGECKHLAFVHQISAGEVCQHCGYPICRPSCPERGARR